MDILKLLSPYELRARILPGMLLTAPALLVVVLVVPLFHSWQALSAAAIGWFALGYPVGQWMRDRAQPQQAALFGSWGGAPTTQVLRWSDATISREEKMIARGSVLRLGDFRWLDEVEERADPSAADAHLKALVSAILSDARRHPERYDRMDRASGHFGFQRNCFYSRPMGSLIAGLSAILAAACAAVPTLGIDGPTLMFAEGVCVGLLVFWQLGVSMKRVRISADGFAIEVFHHIPMLVETRKSATMP